jgi:GAF domain-containing protein
MNDSKDFSWDRLARQAQGLLSVSTDRISNAANLSALIYREMHDVSWVGFYLLHGSVLRLGPFQGKPACVSIDLGKGVCGVAALSGKIMRVADVDQFDGHIACDADSRSELVVPLFKDGVLMGVLDVDSTRYDRFSERDEQGLAELAQIYVSSVA